MNTTEAPLVPFLMPSLGADMDEGSIIEWLIDVGDSVERGQVVARVETEKSDIDIETWQDGVVAEILVGPGPVVPVGTVLMHLRGVGTDDGTNVRERPTTSAERPVPAGAVQATPFARRLAGERGIALSDVTGSGPGGAVRSSDLPERAVPTAADPTDASPTDHSALDARRRADRMRSVIAIRMTRSNDEIPHYRLQRDIDLGPLLDHLAALNADRPISERIVPAAALIRSVALAARRHPEFNGTWTDDRFHPGSAVNVSVAISLRGGGLVTPTIRRADTVSLDATMQLLRDFTTAARTGTLRSEWTASDSSITVTNLGDRGADLVHGLISPPEVALVGFGRIHERPTVFEGAVMPRPVVISTLAADHRATDGAVGSRFLSTLANALEQPDQL